MTHKLATLLLAATTTLFAQQNSLDQVLARLDRLEAENQKLLDEIRALRQDLAKPVNDRVEVLERRSEEVAQTKVEASQRFPIAITGMALFNVWSNGRNAPGQQNPVVASSNAGQASPGASFRQSMIGLRYYGPETIAGGKVTGAIDFDLFGGDSTSLNHLVRLRTATIRVDWANTSVSVGQDKPLIAPRDPDSLAQVSFSPFTAAGNPWLWQPQMRVEQRFSGIKLQASLYETREQYGNLPTAYQNGTSPSRVGYEGRVEFKIKTLQIAPGIHSSISHIKGFSLPSRAYSVDWFFGPLPKWEITGAFYAGENLNTIGGGNPSVNLLPTNQLIPVHSKQGWIQSSWQILPRLKFNAFAGEQANRTGDLLTNNLKSNLAWGGNLMYRLAPNLITSLEALQLRTQYLSNGLRLNNHYDLALAYLF